MDLEALQKELEDLRKDRFETKQRLNVQRFGPGPSLTSPRGDSFERLERSLRHEWDSRQGPNRPDGPPRDLGRGSGFDRPQGPRGSVFGRMSQRAPDAFNNAATEVPTHNAPRMSSERERNGPDALESPSTDVPVVRKRILSAVVVQGSGEETPGEETGEEERNGHEQRDSKRPALESPTEDTGMKKRNRRMFGSLLGTLQKFRDDDKKYQASEQAQRRVEIQRKAEERAKEESERLRRLAAEQRAAQRRSELDHLQEVSLKADMKLLEIIYAKKIQRKEQLNKFLATKTTPVLFWMPVESSEETDALAETLNQELQQWKESMISELEAEKEGLKERSALRREEAARRREAAASRRLQVGNGGGLEARGGAGAEGAGNEEDREEMEAGEYDDADDAKEGAGKSQGHAQGTHKTVVDDSEEPGQVEEGADEEAEMDEDRVVDAEGREANTVEDLLAE
ncbi:hypothetical protein CEUSTIGMA_g8062.t1 [Chlamydomonas eustigma]|uniref:Pinin/SDK/MemA protein domain-containing protein n=1 Tax=Chlamydomonas eustigma TaxID=1157962 RepID=A0A250XC11_9CHLO|nr:hypothetical protein CEUSTIGMA_g8062.t1 [Chlamydomonas eustigma]|eukprot:GAX80627.1 hypothetical protein CEUSTIGMA_g8062.t1 [Chlamydomonas eustigma]